MSSSSSRHQPGFSLSCDVSSSSGPPSQSSPSLPSKVYDCSGRVVLLQEMLQAGVTEIRGGDGRLAYCFFQVLQTSQYLDGSSVCWFQTKDCAAMSSSSLRVGTQVRCNAWLLDEAAKIPYLVSTQWRDGGQVERATLERIQGMPDMADMQVCRL